MGRLDKAKTKIARAIGSCTSDAGSGSAQAVRPSCDAYPLIRLALDGGNGNKCCHSGSDGCDSLSSDDGIETLPPGLPLPDPDRPGIE